MARSKFEISKRSGVHKQLEEIIGSWGGIVRTWFEPGVIADESQIRGSIRPILGGRFVMHEYSSSLSGEPFEGIAIYGYDVTNEIFQSSWIDSFHMGTGIMFSSGNPSKTGFSVLGSYGSPQYPEPWGWRTVLELITRDKLVITAYNISPEGQEDKATEILYERIK